MYLSTVGCVVGIETMTIPEPPADPVPDVIPPPPPPVFGEPAVDVPPAPPAPPPFPPPPTPPNPDAVGDKYAPPPPPPAYAVFDPDSVE